MMTSLAKCPTHGLWRKSASILLIGPGKHGQPLVLTVKRSSKAQFMPNNVVFPGGLCEPEDFSTLWTNVFPEMGGFRVDPSASFPDIFINDSKSNPPDFQELSPHVGFRITAIRELLEETGVLLDQKSGARNVDIETRQRIHKHPEQFCSIIKGLNSVPNIASLHDWSTWLTPVGLKHSNRRYDTQFYVVILDSVEGLSPSSDNAEVSTVQFWGIAEIIAAALSGKILVAPPQMYELARLLNFSTVKELRAYAERRGKLGTERMFPVTVKCRDGLLRVLPGDSLYPEEPDMMGELPLMKLNLTMEECSKLYPKHHRIKVGKGGAFSMQLNVNLNLQQMPPMNYQTKSNL